MTAATIIPTVELDALRTERDNLRAALAAATRADNEVRAELTRYQRAHKSTCPGCELCLPGSDYARIGTSDESRAETMDAREAIQKARQ